MSTHILDAIVRHRWAMLVLSTLVLLAHLSGLPRTRLVSDFEVFFKPDNPDLLAYHALQDSYTTDDNIMFVVSLADGNVFTSRTMGMMTALTILVALLVDFFLLPPLLVWLARLRSRRTVDAPAQAVSLAADKA